MTRRAFLILAGLVFAASTALTMPGCDRAQPQGEPPVDPNALPEIDKPPQMRIVSLAPSLSQILVDMEMGDKIVGVGKDDEVAPAGLPVVGTYTDVNSEALLALKPTHVLTLVTKEGVPANLSRLADAHDFTLAAYRYPNSLNDVAQMIFDETELGVPADDGPDAIPDDGVTSIGSALDAVKPAHHAKLKMLMRIGEIDRITSAVESRPRVLMVFGTDPAVMASGPGTVHDELLRKVGGINAVADASVGAPTLDKESLIVAAPDVVLLLMPGAAPLEPIDTDGRLAAFRDLNIPAVANQRIVLLSDPLILLPSSSLSLVAAQMAKAVHPELAEQIDAAMAADLVSAYAATQSDTPPDAGTEEPASPGQGDPSAAEVAPLEDAPDSFDAQTPAETPSGEVAGDGGGGD